MRRILATVPLLAVSESLQTAIRSEYSQTSQQEDAGQGHFLANVSVKSPDIWQRHHQDQNIGYDIRRRNKTEECLLVEA